MSYTSASSWILCETYLYVLALLTLRLLFQCFCFVQLRTAVEVEALSLAGDLLLAVTEHMAAQGKIPLPAPVQAAYQQKHHTKARAITRQPQAVPRQAMMELCL